MSELILLAVALHVVWCSTTTQRDVGSRQRRDRDKEKHPREVLRWCKRWPTGFV
ncbi:MAG: hypothetical protein AAGJ40_09570 [Planctomycetota bacterium]